jgi:predicted RNase H-like HicB family nuclease
MGAEPRIMEAAARLVSEIVDANCYIIWRDDHDWIAIRRNRPGLSGFGPTPERALAELETAVKLAEETSQ